MTTQAGFTESESMRSPRDRWGTCCPFDPECEHSYIENPDDLTRWMDTPIHDTQAREYER